MRLLIKNIRTLVQTGETPAVIAGSAMKKLSCIDNAWLAMDGDKILSFGTMYEFPGITDWTDLTVIDATNKVVFPCWCDSHTHIVYAGSREGEFADRINGL